MTGWVRGLIGLCALFAGPSVADTPDEAPTDSESVEVVTVTATLEPQTLALTPGSVEIVPGDELQRAQYDGVFEALRHRPGIHADQPGGRGARGSIYTRGLDPNHTKVLIDGIALNDPTNARGGSFDFSTLDNLDTIDRIEIVRGPVSAVQGADAIAGAIQIITQDGKGPDALRLGVSGGRYGYFRGYGSVRGERGPFDLVVAGDYVNEGQPEENGDYRGGSVYSALGLDLPGDARLRGTFFYNDAELEAFPEFSGGTELAVFREFEQRDTRSFAGGLTLTQTPLDWLDYSLRGSIYQRHEERRSPGVAFGVPAEPDTQDDLRRTFLGLRTTAHAPPTLVPGFLSFSVGGDVTWERGETKGDPLVFPPPMIPPVAPVAPDFEESRVIGGPFGEIQWNTDYGLVVLAGVRADFPSGEDVVITPRVSGAYTLDELPLRIDASWGEGYKLASFFALGNPLVGNPLLSPERSRGWDAGLRYEGDRVEARATYFDVRVRDLVDLIFEDPPRLENRGEVRSRGVELEAQIHAFETLDITGYVTYADTFDTATDDELLHRPRWRGGAAFDWRPLENLSLRAALLLVDHVLDSSFPTGFGNAIKLDGYARVDLALSWTPRDWLAVHLAVDNLFDADYHEAIGVPAPGVRPRIGVELRL